MPHWAFCLMGMCVCNGLLHLRLLLTLLALHLQTSHNATLQLLILLVLIEALQGHETALGPGSYSQFLRCLAALQGKGYPAANAETQPLQLQPLREESQLWAASRPT